MFKDYPIEDKCKYQTSEEDYWRTTSYPKCTCEMKYCDKYKGYCPIRDN